MRGKFRSSRRTSPAHAVVDKHRAIQRIGFWLTEGVPAASTTPRLGTRLGRQYCAKRANVCMWVDVPNPKYFCRAVSARRRFSASETLATRSYRRQVHRCSWHDLSSNVLGGVFIRLANNLQCMVVLMTAYDRRGYTYLYRYIARAPESRFGPPLVRNTHPRDAHGPY